MTAAGPSRQATRSPGPTTPRPAPDGVSRSSGPGSCGTVPPGGDSLSSAWWVFPDEPLDGEVLVYGRLLAVAKAAGDFRPVG